MTEQAHHLGGRQFPPVVITDAQTGASEEQSRRVRRYIITMAFRTACFIAMIFVPGAMRWVLFGCAVALPYVAVIFANQVNLRAKAGKPVHPDPETHPELTTGPDDPQFRIIDDRPLQSHPDDDERRSA